MSGVARGVWPLAEGAGAPVALAAVPPACVQTAIQRRLWPVDDVSRIRYPGPLGQLDVLRTGDTHRMRQLKSNPLRSPQNPTPAAASAVELFSTTSRENMERRFAGDSALSLAAKALYSGGYLASPGHVEWDCAGDCQSPRCMFRHEVAEDFFGAVKAEAAAIRIARQAVRALKDSGIAVPADGVTIRKQSHQFGLKLSINVRCRECVNCLEARRRMWAWRAVSEWEASERTWFVTLTCRPSAHDHFKMLAQRASDVRANAWETLSPDEQFIARHRSISSEITRWLKRVRKNSGAVFRYLCVAEAHVSGLPHYHVLIHQQGSDVSVDRRTIEAAWRVGFTQSKLVLDKRAAIYVCKYLGKSMLARVRASKGYGRQPVASLDQSMLMREGRTSKNPLF